MEEITEKHLREIAAKITIMGQEMETIRIAMSLMPYNQDELAGDLTQIYNQYVQLINNFLRDCKIYLDTNKVVDIEIHKWYTGLKKIKKDYNI